MQFRCHWPPLMVKMIFSICRLCTATKVNKLFGGAKSHPTVKKTLTVRVTQKSLTNKLLLKPQYIMNIYLVFSVDDHKSWVTHTKTTCHTSPVWRDTRSGCAQCVTGARTQGDVELVRPSLSCFFSSCLVLPLISRETDVSRLYRK